MSSIRLQNVSFSYSSAVPLLTDVSFAVGKGWSGLVGRNGAGKTTLLSLLEGVITPDAGVIHVDPPGVTPLLCPQRVDELTDDIQLLADAWDRDAVRMRASLHLESSTIGRWNSLSPGERKRWQIGSALVRRPDVLLLDEPTNHLDAEARGMLVDALALFGGCGIVVSHDRRLLNDLTNRTIRMVGDQVQTWNGSYDDARNGWLAAEAETAEKHARLTAERKKLARRIDEQHRKTAKQDAKRKRERRAAGKHDLDTRGSAATYRHERGQKTGAQTVSTMTNSLAGVSADLEATNVRKELGGSVRFDEEQASKEFLVKYRGAVTAGETLLFDIDCAVRRGDRIRIAGANGSGKTSLVRTLLSAASVPNEKVLALDQETTAQDGVEWLKRLALLPTSERGSVLSIVAALGSDPAALLESEQPSPGEVRKLALAFGLGTPKWLLVLDEPTNHLDLPSIERLQSALVDYQGALLLVTHDDALADASTDTVWDVDVLRGGV